jgi:hypothetical protein
MRKMNQLLAEKTYNLIGSADTAGARFRLSPLGELRVEFGTTLNYVIAPHGSISMVDLEIAFEKVPVTEIRCESPGGFAWQIVISRQDGEDLREFLAANARSRREVFGEGDQLD